MSSQRFSEVSWGEWEEHRVDAAYLDPRTGLIHVNTTMQGMPDLPAAWDYAWCGFVLRFDSARRTDAFATCIECIAKTRETAR